MMQLRAAEARGKANFGWLDARHSFSFGHYYDPEWMGHSVLRVINQDLVAPGGGFATHPHANMEILTCVLQGTIEHKDSLGHAEQIPAGDFQLMSAGSGIRHSEYNPSQTDPLSLLQIWIEPNEFGTPPGYQQKKIESRPGMTLVASPDGEAWIAADPPTGPRMAAGTGPGRDARMGTGWPTRLPADDFRGVDRQRSGCPTRRRGTQS